MCAHLVQNGLLNKNEWEIIPMNCVSIFSSISLLLRIKTWLSMEEPWIVDDATLAPEPRSPTFITSPEPPPTHYIVLVVEIDTTKPLVSGTDVHLEGLDLPIFWQRFDFEHVHLFCGACGCVGHRTIRLYGLLFLCFTICFALSGWYGHARRCPFSWCRWWKATSTSSDARSPIGSIFTAVDERRFQQSGHSEADCPVSFWVIKGGRGIWKWPFWGSTYLRSLILLWFCSWRRSYPFSDCRLSEHVCWRLSAILHDEEEREIFALT